MKTWSILLKRLGVIMVLNTLVRALFIAGNYGFLKIGLPDFPGVFLGGFWFDLSATIYLSLPIILLNLWPSKFSINPKVQAVSLYYLLIVNGLFLVLSIVDIGYFRFNFKRNGPELLEISEDIGRLMKQYASDFWYLGILIAVVLYGMFRLLKACDSKLDNELSVLKKLVGMIALLGGLFLGARGGFQMRPIDLATAYSYAKPEAVAAVSNTAFNWISILTKPSLNELHWFTDQQVEEIFPVEQSISSDVQTKPNVVFILVESLSAEFMGELNRGRPSFTPFLDSLSKHSNLFTQAYAAGKHSVDGVLASQTGIPAMGNESFVFSAYQNNQINGIATYLKKLGYSTAFFHGATKNSLNFDNLSKQIGFDKFYSREEYANDADYDGQWGIMDHKFLQFVAKQQSTYSAPFYNFIFTLSSHHPYWLPDSLKSKFPDGKTPICKTIAYADWSIKNYFETVSKMNWYSNTVFVICADHTAWTDDAYFGSKVGSYRIPIMIFDARKPEGKRIDYPVLQSGMLPTILEVCGYSGKVLSFGRSAWKGAQPFTYFEGGAFHGINNGNLLVMDEHSLVGWYPNALDSPLTIQPLTGSFQEIELEKLLKAAAQQYNNRLIKNQLIAH